AEDVEAALAPAGAFDHHRDKRAGDRIDLEFALSAKARGTAEHVDHENPLVLKPRLCRLCASHVQGRSWRWPFVVPYRHSVDTRCDYRVNGIRQLITTNVIKEWVMRGLQTSVAAIAILALPAAVLAQETGDAPAPTSVETAAGRVYTPADFTR